jgi:LmbE family N-acetylglucosaminyl deacetylase
VVTSNESNDAWRRGRLAQRWITVLDRSTAWDPPRTRTVVVSPHPDDESLSSGGLVSLQRRRGLDVAVIAITDGEAAYPGRDPVELANTRRREQDAALHELGVDRADISRLGLPDGDVTAHEHLVEQALLERVQPGDLIIAPWTGDVHPDHEAVGRAARSAAANAGCITMSSMFWTWHARSPEALADVDVVALHLDDRDREARARAVDAHRSQFEHASGSPILRPPHLETLGWPVEIYVAG